MTGVADLVFYLTCSALLAHELDAVHKREWRLLFVLRGMADDRARRAFVLLHVPLVALIIWLLAHSSENVRFWSALGLDLFAVIHAGLHWRLSRHPTYEFNTPHSRLFIYGAAALALFHLLLLWLA